MKVRILSIYGWVLYALGVTRKRRTLERLERHFARNRIPHDEGAMMIIPKYQALSSEDRNEQAKEDA